MPSAQQHSRVREGPVGGSRLGRLGKSVSAQGTRPGRGQAPVPGKTGEEAGGEGTRRGV